jgi:hypothetical protein
MLTFEAVKAEQYAELAEVMIHVGEYLRDTLRLLEMTKDEFDRLFRTVGQVFCI